MKGNEMSNETMQIESKASALRLIDKTYWRLERVCEHSHKWGQYLYIHEEEEKDHQRFKPDGFKAGLTKGQSIRLFVVKQIFERFVPQRGCESVFIPLAKDYLSVKRSIFAACAIADLMGKEITAEFTPEEMRDWLDRIDYVKLNR